MTNLKVLDMKRTGRTTRMLKEAEAAALKGEAVYVVGATKQHTEDMKKIFGKQKAEELGIKFETFKTVDVNWIDRSLQNAHPNCKVLVDHYAIESHFAPILEELHRYDE